MEPLDCNGFELSDGADGDVCVDFDIGKDMDYFYIYKKDIQPIIDWLILFQAMQNDKAETR